MISELQDHAAGLDEFLLLSPGSFQMRHFPLKSLEARQQQESTVDIDVPNIKTKSGNTTVELIQSNDLKEEPDTGVNATVDIPNLDSTQSKTNSCVDNSVPLNTTTEQTNEKL